MVGRRVRKGPKEGGRGKGGGERRKKKDGEKRGMEERMQGGKRWRERGRGKEREREGGRGREARRKEINSRAEPIVPKTLPIILFQIHLSFSLF